MELTNQELQELLDLTVGKGEYELEQGEGMQKITFFKGTAFEKEVEFEVQDEIVTSAYDENKIMYTAIKESRLTQRIEKAVEEYTNHKSRFNCAKEIVAAFINAKEWLVEGFCERMSYNLYYISGEKYAEYRFNDDNTKIRIPYKGEWIDFVTEEGVIELSQEEVKSNETWLFDFVIKELVKSESIRSFDIEKTLLETRQIVGDIQGLLEEFSIAVENMVKGLFEIALQYTETIRYEEGYISWYCGADFCESQLLIEIPNIIEYLEKIENLNVKPYIYEDIIIDGELEYSVEEFKAGAKQSWAKHYEEIKALITLAKRVIAE